MFAISNILRDFILGIEFTMSIITFPVKLDEAYMISPSVKHFAFHSQQDTPFNYIPGQFVTVHFEHAGKTLKRSYSIANLKQNNNRIEFAASFVKDGPGTNFLFNLKLHDVVQMSGPFGRLILKDVNPKRYIFIATSTGVTPFRAMINELKKRLKSNPDLSCVVIMGVQKREDILYSDDFLAFASELPPRVKFHAYLSRENIHELFLHESKGHVQDGFDNLNLNPSEDIIYLCGNPTMIDDSFSLLKEKGFSQQNIIREKYISAK